MPSVQLSQAWESIAEESRLLLPGCEDMVMSRSLSCGDQWKVRKGRSGRAVVAGRRDLLFTGVNSQRSQIILATARGGRYAITCSRLACRPLSRTAMTAGFGGRESPLFNPFLPTRERANRSGAAASDQPGGGV